MTRPRLYYRDCRHCWQYIYQDFEPENPKEGPGLDELVTHNGEPMTRESGGPPCVWGSCPKGHIDSPRVLSRRNERVYYHYLECRAVGQFPDDAVVRRNARLIRAVEDAVDKLERTELAGLSTMRTP